MRPFTAILGFVAGSLCSVAFGLAVVLMVFWLLRNDHPQFSAELPELARGSSMFMLLATLSAVAFWATIRERPWRYAPLTLLWVGLLLIGRYYWPT
jgi:hypothetical protein